MALNKFMHPRNIYKVPPDFSKLAEKFAEFKQVTKRDVLGKICIDFKDPTALRLLTRCLLKSDFGLDIEIPEDRLVPTLPLRLNYILWIEDMLKAIKTTDKILGVDIGTGACAIYPLLAAVKNKWHMVGTETDEISIKMAIDNVKRNELEDFVNLKAPADNTLIAHLLHENTQIYDFCMCNPPFYSSVQELCESRSIARPPPKNAFTGSPQELITEGGELEFIRKLIAESKAHQNRVRIFTTMVGHKYNLKELQQDLKTDGITHVMTEFCQGRVTRWGLAWTFESYQLDQQDYLKIKPHKKLVPISFKIPQLADTNNFKTVLNKLKIIFNEINIKYKVKYKKTDYCTMEIIANNNTWSNQRKKRRQMNREDQICTKKAKGEVQIDIIHEEELSAPSTSDLGNGNINLKTESNNDDIEKSTDIIKLTPAQLTSNTESSASANEPFVRAHVGLCKKENDLILEISFLSGNGGKEAVHQILQFIKNNLK